MRLLAEGRASEIFDLGDPDVTADERARLTTGA
jgi:hypothetical protein